MGLPARSGTWPQIRQTRRSEAFHPRLSSPWARRRAEPLQTFPASGAEKLQLNDLAHFCAHLVSKKAADKVIAKFDRFCIVGQPLQRALSAQEMERQGKSYIYATSYAPEILKHLPQDYDCLVICGAQGDFAIEGPAVALMRANKISRTNAIDDPALEKTAFKPALHANPASGTDWFYPFDLEQQVNTRQLVSVRAVHKNAQREAARRLGPA